MDDIPTRLTQLFEEQRGKGGAGGRWATRHQRATLEQAYLKTAESVLVDENPFKFTIVSISVDVHLYLKVLFRFCTCLKLHVDYIK